MFEGLPGLRPFPPGRARRTGVRRRRPTSGAASRPSGAGRWRCSACAPGMAVERDDVQRRFRRLVRLAHPDHGAGSAGAAERIAELAEARELLLLGLVDLGRRATERDRFGYAAWLPTPSTSPSRGAAGQIGYALVHRIACGQLLGPDQPVVLRLLEIEPAMNALEGVVMELEDGAHPLLVGIEATADLKTAFDGTSWALLVGSIPRKAGMERGDLLKVNGGIFRPQGQAINDHAAERRARARRRQPVQHQLPHRPVERARRPRRPLVRDDPPRREPGQDAARQEGRRAVTPRSRNVAIWGNHSATQFPDFAHARIGGKPGARRDRRHRLARRASSSRRCRSAAPRSSRSAVQSSAASAAHAAIDSVNSVHIADPGRRLALARGRAARASTACPRACSSASRCAATARRGRSSRASSTTTSRREDRAHHPRARRRARRGRARSACSRELTRLGGALVVGVRRRPRASPGRSGSRPRRHASRRYRAESSCPTAGVVRRARRRGRAPRRARCSVVRAEGLWAELLCETPGEHWSFGLEAFGVRFDDAAEAAASDRGERVPWASTSSGRRPTASIGEDPLGRGSSTSSTATGRFDERMAASVG